MTAVTQWFADYTKPCRVGIYETRFFGLIDMQTGYSYWNGNAWSYQESSAERIPRGYEGFQEKEWRGLAEKPA